VAKKKAHLCAEICAKPGRRPGKSLSRARNGEELKWRWGGEKVDVEKARRNKKGGRRRALLRLQGNVQGEKGRLYGSRRAQ